MLGRRSDWIAGLVPGLRSQPRTWAAARSLAIGVVGAVLAASVVVTGCGGGSHMATSGTGEPTETCESSYILPTSLDAFQVVADRAGDGPFVMLNLYRLREFADYSASPELAPETPISGIEAFERLAATLDAELAKVGGEIIFRAEGGAPFIGPSDERWDIVQLVRYPSYEAFTEFANTETVQRSIPDRIAGLEDSRVIPLAALNH
jgi:hypothetical protein